MTTLTVKIQQFQAQQHQAFAELVSNMLQELNTRDQNLREREERLIKAEASLIEHEKRFEDRLNELSDLKHKSCEKIKLNIGGTLFTTTIDTLTVEQDTLFTGMFSGKFDMKPDDDGEYFLDRNPEYFSIILDYLRGVDIEEQLLEYSSAQLSQLIQEVDYYGITSLLELARKLTEKNHIKNNKRSRSEYEQSSNNNVHYENTLRANRTANRDYLTLEDIFNFTPAHFVL
jgi:DNA anti-recombination protein RmuC